MFGMMRKLTVHIWLLPLLVFLGCLGWVLGVTSSSASGHALHDIADSYAREQIVSLYDAGIVSGDENGYFHPKRPVTRAEFVAMLNRTIGLKPVASSIAAYADVPKSSWAYKEIQAASSLGLVNGTGSRTFSPQRSISREEAAAILVRALSSTTASASRTSLRDAHTISPWALPAVRQVIEKEWMTGYQGYFRPADSLTREETAVIFQRIFTLLNQQKSSANKRISLGWQYQSTTAEFIAQVKKSNVNTLSPRWFFLQADGSVSVNADASLVRWAHDNGKDVWPMFGNKFDAEATHAVLSDARKRAEVVQTIAQYVDQYELDGINVDFEGFSPDDRDHFTAFIKELASALGESGAVVSVDIPPDTGTDWSDPFDYEKLAAHADYLVVMAYDQHWSGGPKAGSVSSLPWMEKVVADLLAQIPADQLVVGLPLYTREWYTSNGKVQSNDLRMPESYQMVSRYNGRMWWDAALGQYVATYNRQGVNYTVWLEDVRSLGLKTKSGLNRQVAGFAYWYIGSESSDVWTAISNAIALQQARQQL